MTTIADRVLDLAIQIQQIAAPTFHEQKRAEFVRGLFAGAGLRDVAMDEAGNVYGRWAADNGQWKAGSKPLIVSAHLDTVFPFDMDLSIQREEQRVHGIGIGDNSLGVAAMFGLMWMLREVHPPELAPGASGDQTDAPLPYRHNASGKGDIWFVANTCEEGLGDLRGMKAVVERFGSDVTGYLVLEGMALGHIYHKAVGVKRYRITARTPGGHSWSDYGQPSAVLELSKLVVQLAALKLPSRPRTTMNVGKIQGGTSVNTIPAEASLELDLRSEGQSELADLVEGVERLIEAAGRPGVQADAEVIGWRPAGEIDSNHPLIKLAQACLHAQGLEATLTSGSTDANIPLSKGYPALVLGVTRGGGAHTNHEFIETEPVAKGMKQLFDFVTQAREK